MEQTQFEYIRSASRADELCRQLLDRSKVVGLDTETTGLDPHRDRVVLLSLTDSAGTYVVDTRDPRCLSAFRPLLEKEEIPKVGVNIGFDYQLIKGSAGIDTEGLMDLSLAERCLTAGVQFSGFGFADMAKKYLDVNLDKALQTSFIQHAGEYSKEQLEYAAADTRVLLPLARVMQEKVKESGVGKIWKIENNSISAFSDMEFYGQKIDVAAWEKMMGDNLQKAREAKDELDSIFAPLCEKDEFGKVLINYDSVPQVLAVLRAMDIHVDGELIAKTNKKVQNKIKNLPVIQALTRYRSAVKLHGTYGQQYIDAIHPITKRVHFRFNQYGTETGRPACWGKLNCLNIPREKRYRTAFITEDDRLISTVDYAAAELRILAELSGEQRMIDGFNSGIDFHCFVAGMMFGKVVTKEDPMRTAVKPINFGKAYGLSPVSLWEQVNAAGVAMSKPEAKDLFYLYERTFPTMTKWLKSEQVTAQTKFEMVNMNGRKRRWFAPDKDKIKAALIATATKKGKLELTEEMQVTQVWPHIDQKWNAHLAAVAREGANFQIQSVNADFSKDAMYRMRKAFKQKGWDARLYNMVYDEIVLDAHQSIAEDAHALQKKIMIESAEKMLKKVPMETDGHLEKCWTK